MVAYWPVAKNQKSRAGRCFFVHFVPSIDRSACLFVLVYMHLFSSNGRLSLYKLSTAAEKIDVFMVYAAFPFEMWFA